MAFIFWVSTDRFSGSNTGSVLEAILQGLGLSLSHDSLEPIHFAIRKLAHLGGYAVLALLLYRAFRGGAKTAWMSRWAVSAFAVAAAYALFDEYHQSWTAQRTASIWDSLIDMAGSLIALGYVRISSYSRQSVRDGEIGPGK